ncbi:MAG: hypothetical protein ACK56I_17840, partial [bacterium]
AQQRVGPPARHAARARSQAGGLTCPAERSGRGERGARTGAAARCGACEEAAGWPPHVGCPP